MDKSFHGRTLGALTATGQKKYQKGFGPLLEGFKTVPFNDYDALCAAITPKTIAIIIEPVQGEGGINVADPDYVKKIRRLCDEKDILLFFDEVQTGMGRTGTMYAYQNYGIVPDGMMLAKSLGGGLPIGVLLVQKRLAGVFQPGMHASTFGGSPLVCKAALGVFKALRADKMLANAKKMSLYAFAKLGALRQKYPAIKTVKGLGLMIGVELHIPGKPIVEHCFQKGLLINCTQESVLRLMPALNVTRKEMDKALRILGEAFAACPAEEKR